MSRTRERVGRTSRTLASGAGDFRRRFMPRLWAASAQKGGGLRAPDPHEDALNLGAHLPPANSASPPSSPSPPTQPVRSADRGPSPARARLSLQILACSGWPSTTRIRPCHTRSPPGHSPASIQSSAIDDNWPRFSSPRFTHSAHSLMGTRVPLPYLANSPAR